MKSDSCEILIVGGGLAGLCVAIELAKNQFNVTVVEPKKYPRHKVCGEYISKEVLPYLQVLGLNPWNLGAVSIERFEWTHPNGKKLSAKLPLGGFGISRYTLENALFEFAKDSGVRFIFKAATQLLSPEDGVEVLLDNGLQIKAQLGIAAYGKRAALDKQLGRDFMDQKADFMAAKWHAEGDFPDDLVALHNFNGGYCGVSKVEAGKINFCFISSYKSFKKHKSIQVFTEQVLSKNRHLKELLSQTTVLFEKPLSIAQISFKNKAPIEGNWIMCGDTAGLIHPLSGNGMSMAIGSAELAVKHVTNFLKGRTSRLQLLHSYRDDWKAEFKRRLFMGRIAAFVFKSDLLSASAVNLLQYNPGMLRYFIKQTHGQLSTPERLEA